MEDADGLRGKHVLVTGAAGGIGFITAKMFVQLGARVTFHYNSKLGNAELFLQENPSNTFAVQADVHDEKAVESAVNSAVQKFGVINVLVANHAFFAKEAVSIADMTLEQWKNTLDVNLTGIFLFTREYLKQLRMHTTAFSAEEKLSFLATIVIVGSTAGKFGEEGRADYSASKSALMYGFTRTLKNDIVKIVPRGRVNVVSPGWVMTPNAEPYVKMGLHHKALQTMTLTKVASCEDCANGIVFLAGRRSSHTTGSILKIDGGFEGRVINDLSELQSCFSST